MAAKHFEEMKNSFNQGIVSANETANALLYALISKHNVESDAVFAVGCMPDEVKAAFGRLMQRIRANEYRWVPFFITSNVEEANAEIHSGKLRKIDALLAEMGLRGHLT